MTTGKLKVRGIEMRRSDTPGLIISLQEAMLSKLAEAVAGGGQRYLYSYGI